MNQEFEKILKQRERQKHYEELSELETKLASAHYGIFWSALNLLIVGPLFVTGTAYYFWSQMSEAAEQNLQIINFFSNVKWAAIGLAIGFLIASISLLWNLWRVASFKSEIAKLRGKINSLEK